MEAFEICLNNRPDQCIPTWYLMCLLKEVLLGNIFIFNDKYYRQTVGTAMGTVAAPSYACIFMGWLEEQKLLGNWHGTKPRLYCRYIDDIIFIWDGTIEELRQFIDHLNVQHPSIKFEPTFNQEKREVPFLDMTVSIDSQGKIATDLYKKETAVVQYLLPSSCYPSHVARNIPYSLGYWLLRLFSSPETFGKRLEDLRLDLLSRKYNAKIIEEAFKRVKQIPREEALKKVVRNKQSEREPCVVSYHPLLPSVAKTIRKHHGVMTEQLQQLKRIFPRPSVVAYKRSKNLGDMLIRAKVSSKRRSQRRKNGFKHCTRVCILCKTSLETKYHECHCTKERWNIQAPINCQTENVVYRLRCKKCPDFVYIGETKRRFCDRIQDHRSAIRQKRLDHPIGSHFNKAGHSVTDLIPLAIERVLPRNDTALRKRREKLWINRYDSTTFGSNTRD